MHPDNDRLPRRCVDPVPFSTLGSVSDTVAHERARSEETGLADSAAAVTAERLARAEGDAERAAARSGVQVRTIDDPAGHQQAAEVLQQIWEHPAGAPLPPAMLRAFDYTGNYVAAAFEGDRMVGAATGFHTDHGALHSHIAGVLPSHQGRAIGYVLKLHQRAWALRRGIAVIAWTFDPLIRRNAHFNLVKLGATVAAYLPDFYGEMTDHINAGDHSDRLLVEWDLRKPVPGAAVTAAADAVTVLCARQDEQPELQSGTGHERLLQLPVDVEALRRTDPALARQWRAALREALAGVLADGHRIVGLDPHSAYLTRRESS
jgi:predicted GNAT superfamily acetyltransferase